MRTFALILLIIDAIATLVLYGFFFIGIGDGSVSAFNMGLWLLILAAFTVAVVVGWLLRAKGRPGLASVVLLPTAIPCAFYGQFLLLILILQPRWN
jgi:hypothetical protein